MKPGGKDENVGVSSDMVVTGSSVVGESALSAISQR
jgi:hypothetical protein